MRRENTSTGDPLRIKKVPWPRKREATKKGTCLASEKKYGSLRLLPKEGPSKGESAAPLSSGAQKRERFWGKTLRKKHES